MIARHRPPGGKGLLCATHLSGTYDLSLPGGDRSHEMCGIRRQPVVMCVIVLGNGCVGNVESEQIVHLVTLEVLQLARCHFY